MKKSIYTNYRQFFFKQRGSLLSTSIHTPYKSSFSEGIYYGSIHGKSSLVSGKRSRATQGLNDYQYIKCKWLFELLTGNKVAIHKDYGLILGRGANSVGVKPSHADWPHVLLGNAYRVYDAVFKKAT